jgi:enoyl-CoA hydratase/carnithine racemase
MVDEGHPGIELEQRRRGCSTCATARTASTGRRSALHAALDTVDAVEGPAALVTTGEGKFFSNGLDLDWLMGGGEGTEGFIDEVHRLLGRVLGFGAATVAAVNGHAFAGGGMLAVAHDYVVMREDRGFWCLPEVDLGLP